MSLPARLMGHSTTKSNATDVEHSPCFLTIHLPPSTDDDVLEQRLSLHRKNWALWLTTLDLGLAAPCYFFSFPLPQAESQPAP